MLKQSRTLFPCCRTIHTSTPSLATSSTSSSPRQTLYVEQQGRAQHSGKCTYSTTVVLCDRAGRTEQPSLPWPEVGANQIPTPYQIFGQRKGGPYSKQRFYELVKLYHPDKHDVGADDGLAYATKLERYRLVVAANAILSDPVKRGAYDTYGAGWNGQPDVRLREGKHGPNSHWGDYSGKGWGGGGGGPGGPSQNATWEDWERWYERESGGKQEPAFVSNGAFVSLVAILAALGGVANATRANNYGIDFVKQKDALHDQVSKDLVKRRRESSTSSDRDERIQTFLRQRDALGYDIADPAEDRFRKMLPEPEVCSSEDVKSRSMGAYKPQKGGIR